MRLIDADALLEKMKGTDRYFMIKFDIEEAPTVDQWHYPSQGEYPPLLEYVLCKLTDDTYEIGYYQGQIDGEPEWAFTCFLGDVVAWQYLEPPKEEA